MSLRITNYELQIKELDKQILQNANLEVKEGEIVVLIGANGSGKSSFAMSLIGIPGYERSGKVEVDSKETLDLNMDEIAKAGLFVSFQSPPEIEGLSLFDFINSAYTSASSVQADSGIERLSSFKLRKKILETANLVGLNETFLTRSTNQGFSGGERRKSEVLQMLVLEPKVAILDEVDSGLDIKSTANIARILSQIAREKNTAIIVISHSPEFIRKLQPNKIVELKDKKFEEVSIEDIEKYAD
jgi:Fe-S cluster assembly ATP-binding protein